VPDLGVAFTGSFQHRAGHIWSVAGRGYGPTKGGSGGRVLDGDNQNHLNGGTREAGTPWMNARKPVGKTSKGERREPEEEAPQKRYFMDSRSKKNGRWLPTEGKPGSAYHWEKREDFPSSP